MRIKAEPNTSPSPLHLPPPVSSPTDTSPIDIFQFLQEESTLSPPTPPLFLTPLQPPHLLAPALVSSLSLSNDEAEYSAPLSSCTPIEVGSDVSITDSLPSPTARALRAHWSQVLLESRRRTQVKLEAEAERASALLRSFDDYEGGGGEDEDSEGEEGLYDPDVAFTDEEREEPMDEWVELHESQASVEGEDSEGEDTKEEEQREGEEEGKEEELEKFQRWVAEKKGIQVERSWEESEEEDEEEDEEMKGMDEDVGRRDTAGHSDEERQLSSRTRSSRKDKRREREERSERRSHRHREKEQQRQQRWESKGRRDSEDDGQDEEERDEVATSRGRHHPRSSSRGHSSRSARLCRSSSDSSQRTPRPRPSRSDSVDRSPVTWLSDGSKEEDTYDDRRSSLHGTEERRGGHRKRHRRSLTRSPENRTGTRPSRRRRHHRSHSRRRSSSPPRSRRSTDRNVSRRSSSAESEEEEEEEEREREDVSSVEEEVIHPSRAGRVHLSPAARSDEEDGWDEEIMDATMRASDHLQSLSSSDHSSIAYQSQEVRESEEDFDESHDAMATHISSRSRSTRRNEKQASSPSSPLLDDSRFEETQTITTKTVTTTTQTIHTVVDPPLIRLPRRARREHSGDLSELLRATTLTVSPLPHQIQQLQRRSTEEKIDAILCVECGLRLHPQDVVSRWYCSSLCEAWVSHKRFLAQHFRATHSQWKSLLASYWQPGHNLPLLLHSPAVPTLPFYTLARSHIPFAAPLLPKYLLYQLALYPYITLRPSPLHGHGVFATRPIPPHTRIIPVFGTLYPRTDFFHHDGSRREAAKGRTRLLDVDELSVKTVEYVMDISDACVGGYVNSAMGKRGSKENTTVRRERNVRFICDEQMKGTWEEEGWVPSALMIIESVAHIAEGEELLEKYPH